MNAVNKLKDDVENDMALYLFSNQQNTLFYFFPNNLYQPIHI